MIAHREHTDIGWKICILHITFRSGNFALSFPVVHLTLIDKRNSLRLANCADNDLKWKSKIKCDVYYYGSVLHGFGAYCTYFRPNTRYSKMFVLMNEEWSEKDDTVYCTVIVRITGISRFVHIEGYTYWFSHTPKKRTKKKRTT